MPSGPAAGALNPPPPALASGLIGAVPDYHRGTAAEPQPLRGAVLGAGDLDHPEGVHEREILPGTRVAVGAQQGKGMVPRVHQRQPEALDECGVDVGDEVAEVIDADDHAGDAARLDSRVL